MELIWKLDDGWPESLEEQGLLLLVLRHYITSQYIERCIISRRDKWYQDNLHTDAFTQRLLHTGAFTHRHFYTQTLLHTDAFTHLRSHERQFLVMNAKSDYLMVG